MVAFIVKEHKASWVTYLLSPIERARELNGYCYKHLSQPDKLALREGIDFILDPLYSPIKDDLFEHIDGLKTCETRFK
jgi:hypothetical protein